ncbi:hypothetical protein D3C86_1349610 [compost metagenome]
MHLLGLGERPPVVASVDDIRTLEALAGEQLARRQHAELNVHDDIRCTSDVYRHQRQPVAGGDCGERVAQVAPLAAVAVVLHEECRDFQGADFMDRRERFQIDADKLLLTAGGGDGGQRIPRVVAGPLIEAAVHLRHECRYQRVFCSPGGYNAQRLANVQHARRLPLALSVAGLD